MKLKKFRAANMAEAMRIIKEEIGPDAVIMSSRQVKQKKGLFGLFGKREFEVVAGFEEEDIKPKTFQAAMINSEAAARFTPAQPAAVRPMIKETPAPQAAEPPRETNALASSVDELKGMIEQLSERVGATEVPPQKRFSREVAALYQRLLKNGVEAGVAEEICTQTETITESRGADAEDVAASLIRDILGNPHPVEPTKYRRKTVMLAGPTGVGKTTTLIKLAYMLVYQEKLNIGVINADSFRVAAKEHIEAYCEILKTDMVTIYKPEEIKEAMEAFADKDVVLIDTAGKVSDDKEYLMDIAKLVSIGKVDEVYITLSASTSERVLKSTLEHYNYLKKYSIIVTKTDEAPERGVFLYLAKISGRPLSYMTTGQTVPDDIKVVDPDEIVGSVLEN